MAKRTEAWIRDEVKSEEASQEESKQQWNADDEEDSLAEGVPLPKGDVWYKDDGGWETKQQTTCGKVTVSVVDNIIVSVVNCAVLSTCVATVYYII